MKKLQLRGRDLRNIGFPEGPVISIAINIMQKEFKHLSLADALKVLQAVLQSPNQYAGEDKLAKIAEALLPKPKTTVEEIPLKKESVPFNVFGQEFIEPGALHQMHVAAKLPVAVTGALMPDAHTGYGLPIGGVLATENVVIPYGVGVDIGCRMCLSVFDLATEELQEKEPQFSRMLNEHTLFGSGGQFDKVPDHEVLDRKEFDELGILKGLQDRAWKQLGTSGSGNHFVEFGIVEVLEKDAVVTLAPGKYVGLLSHSGSRALGANIANYYTRLAKEKRKLTGGAQELAWLHLDEEAGAEYWMAMNLAGDYASACHHVIHNKISRALGQEPLLRIENHHNFAWKEQWEGREVIVHRKGATPAGKDVPGIIPGSMTAPGFIVKGKGEPASLYSASHGAGRRMSRTQALKNITHHTLNNLLRQHDVKLIGGGLDEAPLAYKDIYSVMRSQQQLVTTLGLFHPKIVRMDGAAPKQWRKKKNEILGE